MDSYLSLIESSYNNSFLSSIRMAHFKALYSKRCRPLLFLYESGENVVLGPKIVQQTTEKVKMFKKR